MDITVIPYYEDTPGTNKIEGYVGAAGSLNVGSSEVAVAAGTHKAGCCVLIDSASREGAAKLYDAVTRLEQSIQYKDHALTLTDGAAVTSVPGLTAIGTDGKFSDGAWHPQLT